MARVIYIEHGASGADESFGRYTTHIETVPAHERLLDQGHLRAETCCACRGYQSSRPGADHDEIVEGGGGMVLPIRRVDIGNEARIVRIRRGDQDMGMRAHGACALSPVSLPLIFLARALRAT